MAAGPPALTAPAAHAVPRRTRPARRPAIYYALALCGAILLLGFGLRVLDLGRQSLWYDEAYSVFYARRGFTAIVGQQQADPLPYFLLLWLWSRAAGSTEFAVRFLSVALGMLTLPATYQLLRALGRPAIGLAAAAILAMSGFHVYYSQEARLHVLAGLLAAVILGTFVRALKRESRRRWLAYGLAAAAGIWSYYYLLLLVAGLNLPLLVSRRRSRGWYAANAGAALAALPGLALAYRKVTAFSEPYLPPIGPSPSMFALEAPGYLLLGPTTGRYWLWAAGALVVALALPGGIVLARSGSPGWRCIVWALVVAGAGVPLIPAALHTFTHPRYEIVVLPALLAVFLYGAWRWAPTRRWLWPGAAALLLGAGISLYNGHANPAFQRDDNRGAVALLRLQAQPGDLLIYDLPLQYDVLDYYGRDLAPDLQALPVPKNPALPRDRQFAPETGDRLATEQKLADLSPRYSDVWLLLSGDPAHWTEDWLDAHRLVVMNRWFGNVRLKRYLPRPAPDLRLAQPVRVERQYGPLRLAAVEAGDLRPGRMWPVRLLWRVVAPPPAAYTVSAQLFDADGRRVVQLDRPPLEGALPTTGWVVGDRYEDVMDVPLPAPLAAGLYELRLSIYGPAGQAGQQQPILRLPLLDRPLSGSIDAVSAAGWTVESLALGHDGEGAFVVAADGTVQAQPAADYTWFVHLLDASGHIVAQQDRPPLAPTSTWRPGDVVREVFRIPPAPGAVSLELGAYDSAGRRAMYRLASGATSDHILAPAG